MQRFSNRLKMTCNEVGTKKMTHELLDDCATDVLTIFSQIL